MSGIVGVFRLDGRPANTSIFHRAVGTIAHRGPDASGQWSDGDVALAWHVLRTTPESITDEHVVVGGGGRYILVADARVDNRGELIDVLGLGESEPSDAALIMAAFVRWGRDCAERLIGDFAFAVWDRHEKEFFCARDPMGVRPLFYCHLPNRLFAFASEIKALHALEPSLHTVNEEMIARYLADCDLYMAEQEQTCFERVLRLPMGRAMTVGANGLRTWTYWEPPVEPELRFDTEAEYVEGFRECFTQAVQCRIRSTSPVGSMLSGGLDSSAVTATARHLERKKEGARPVHSFSAIYPGLPDEELELIDEREYVEAVLATGDIRSHMIRADRVGPLHDIGAILASTDDLFFGPNGFLHWETLKRCKQHDVRVLLDGTDGDTVVSHGHTYLRELATRGDWKAFRRAIGADRPVAERLAPPQNYFRAYGGRDRLAGLARTGRWLSYVREVRTVVQQLDMTVTDVVLGQGGTPVRVFRRMARQARHAFSPDHRKDELTKTVLSKALSHQHRLVTEAVDVEPEPSTRQNRHRQAIFRGHWQYGMEAFDALAAPHQVEMRFPFFDRRLIEYCLRMPGELQRCGGWGRYVLRKAMEGILPRAVQWRVGKSLLGPGFTHGMIRYDKERLRRIVYGDAERLATYVDVDEVRKVYSTYIANPRGQPGYELTLYRVAVLAEWLRRLQR